MFVFLDFDGVTHPVSGATPFQHSCLNALELAFTRINAEIIITSTWRLDRSINEIRILLGENIGKRVIDVTPNLDLDPYIKWPRAREVIAWLDYNGMEEKTWSSIDDEAGNYPEGYSFLCNNRTGFTKSDISLFIEYTQTVKSDIRLLL
jgi:hypothetical protein